MLAGSGCGDAGEVAGGRWEPYSIRFAKGLFEELGLSFVQGSFDLFHRYSDFKKTNVNSILTIICCTPTMCKAKLLARHESRGETTELNST